MWFGGRDRIGGIRSFVAGATAAKPGWWTLAPAANTELKLGRDDCCGFQNVGELLLMSVDRARARAASRLSSDVSSDPVSSRRKVGDLLAAIGWKTDSSVSMSLVVAEVVVCCIRSSKSFIGSYSLGQDCSGRGEKYNELLYT